jgi:hypothetical protein
MAEFAAESFLLKRLASRENRAMSIEAMIPSIPQKIIKKANPRNMEGPRRVAAKAPAKAAILMPKNQLNHVKYICQMSL